MKPAQTVQGPLAQALDCWELEQGPSALFLEQKQTAPERAFPLASETGWPLCPAPKRGPLLG